GLRWLSTHSLLVKPADHVQGRAYGNGRRGQCARDPRACRTGFEVQVIGRGAGEGRRECKLAIESGLRPDSLMGLLDANGGRSAPHRIGGAYCKPPWLQRLLSPRAILRRDPEPRLRSKISP